MSGHLLGGLSALRLMPRYAPCFETYGSGKKAVHNIIALHVSYLIYLQQGRLLSYYYLASCPRTRLTVNMLWCLVAIVELQLVTYGKREEKK